MVEAKNNPSIWAKTSCKRCNGRGLIRRAYPNTDPLSNDKWTYKEETCECVVKNVVKECSK